MVDESLSNQVLGIEGPHIQMIDSIAVDISSGETCTTTADKCNHFTIRGFVSDVRSKGSKIYSPFVSDGETVSVKENSFMLPHIQVHRSRRWQCSGCLQDIIISSSKGTKSMVTAVSPPTAISGAEKSRIFSSRRTSMKLSKSNRIQRLHRVRLAYQTVRPKVKDHSKPKNHITEGSLAPPSGFVNGKKMRSHSHKPSCRNIVHERSFTQAAAPKEVYLSPPSRHLDGPKTSCAELANQEPYSREVASYSKGKSPALTPVPSSAIAIACGDFSSSGQKVNEENSLGEGHSSQRFPMALLSGCTKGKSTSQKPGLSRRALLEVPFASTNIHGDGTSCLSLKLSHDRPEPNSGSPKGTSRGSVMGPPRSYPYEKNYSAQENGLQIGKRHYAKRTMQPQDNKEGCGVVFKESSDQVGFKQTASSDQEADHIEEPVSPKSKRTIEVVSKGKGVANISFASEGKILLANTDQRANEASSSFGKYKDDKAVICTKVVKTTGPHNMLTGHSVPSLEESNSGESTSGHVDDDDDEDYEEEEDEGGRYLRPRRAPKIISLKKVMDKADLQNAQSSMKVGAKNRKRKIKSQGGVYSSRNSNGSPSDGSKRVATRDIGQEYISISPKKNLNKRALERPDPEKNKKLRSNKSYVSSVSFQDKYEPEHCHEKRSQKKRMAKDKADGSYKKRGKRKADVSGTRERSPTSCKGMQSEDAKTATELQKVVYPDSNIQVSKCKDNILKENIEDTTTFSLAVRDDGGDKVMTKGKEKLVDGVEVAKSSMLHLRGAGESSSPPGNYETQQADRQGQVKDFDINVPVEEVPMDIVELMAKNQLERTRDDVVDKPIIMQEPVISQSRGFYPTDSMALCNPGIDRSHHPHGIHVKPPADYLGLGLAKTGPVRSVRQLSEYLVESHESTLLVGYPKDNLLSNARLAGSYVPQCLDQVPGRAPYSSLGSMMGGTWRHNPLACRAPDDNLIHRGSSFSRYQGGFLSSPLNSTIWPPSKSAVMGSQASVGGGLVNQRMFSSDFAPIRGPQNNQISSGFDLFAQNTQKNGAPSPYPSVEDFSKHSYGSGKHQMVNYLPLKATGPEDLSSNDVMPALQLLNIMHSGQSQSDRRLACEVNNNRNVSSMCKSVLEPCYHQYSKQYMAGLHPHFEGCMSSSGGSRHLPLETRGGRSTSSVDKACSNYANLATHQQLSNSSLCLRNQSAEKNSVGFANPLSFPSHGQRSRFGNSAQSSSKIVDFRVQKPLSLGHNLDREQQGVPATSKGQTGYGGPSGWSLEALNSMNNQTRPRKATLARSEQVASLPTPNIEDCVVNRNPAEIIDPREASKFTIKLDELRRSTSKRIQMVC